MGVAETLGAVIQLMQALGILGMIQGYLLALLVIGLIAFLYSKMS